MIYVINLNNLSAVLSNVFYIQASPSFLSFRTKRWFKESDHGNPIRLYFTYSRLLQLQSLQLLSIIRKILKLANSRTFIDFYPLILACSSWLFSFSIFCFLPNVSKFLRKSMFISGIIMELFRIY